MSRKFLILAEGKFSPLRSKTANGAIVYLRDEVAAVIDSTKAGMTAQQVLGYGGDIPVVRDLAEGMKFRPTHLLIGIAPSGGRLPEEWKAQLKQALGLKLHVLSGLHTILSDDPELSTLASAQGVTITDYRKIPPESEVVTKGSWKTRKGKAVLTVGSDCNIGKMTTILEVRKELVRRGLKADFVATGQTGMMIRGRGIAVDSIIGDYIGGCIEREIDQSDAEGYEYILVEGQGALTHVGYSGVTLGLLHGSMPDAMILCHQPTRTKDDYGLTIPGLKPLVELHEKLVRFFRETKVVGIGINSIGLNDEESRRAAEAIERETGLPAVDAFRFGAAKIVDALIQYFGPARRQQ
ncbi:MAG TPA: DUF1611 domain-containing protein [Bacteroidota bacterium]